MKFVIHGRLPSLNDYVLACRSNRYAGASMKKRNEQLIDKAILKAIDGGFLRRVNKYPITLKITWYEPNKRRDIDNITFAVKFIQDSLVKAEIIQDDSQKFLNRNLHDVQVDVENPRIEVEIIERS